MSGSGGYKKKVFLSLGSNLGDRAANLERAVAELEGAGLIVLRRSAVYETEPVEVAGQPWFLNCVVEVETDLMPLGLLHTLQRIERALGRDRTGATHGPRTLDIDILLFGDSIVHLPELTIPHPRMSERRFVLEPLREIVPEVRHPVTRKTPAEMLEELTSPAQVRRYAG